MSLYIVEHSEGVRELIATTGYSILSNGELYQSLYIPSDKTVEDYEYIKNSDYVPPVIEEDNPESKLESLKMNQIKISKSNLSTYLEENPLFSTVKYEDGRYYNVTLEKQYSLTDRLLKYTVFKNAGGNYVLWWNSVGQTSERWEYKELLQLSTEIEEYVNPLVELQREVELRIRECTTQEDVLSVDINPYREEALRLNEANTLNNK